jgi:hypothetical protein
MLTQRSIVASSLLLVFVDVADEKWLSDQPRVTRSHMSCSAEYITAKRMSNFAVVLLVVLFDNPMCLMRRVKSIELQIILQLHSLLQEGYTTGIRCQLVYFASSLRIILGALSLMSEAISPGRAQTAPSDVLP